MVPETRRSLLHGVAGLAVALAGCSGLSGSGESSSTESIDSASDGPASTPDGPGAGSASNPEMHLVRSDGDRSPIWHGTQSEQTPRRTDPIDNSVVVDTAAKAGRLSVADSFDRDRLDSFLDGTDFDTETLYLETVRVEECFRLSLCRIEWQSDEVRTDYVRQLRPYTEPCGVDNRVVETRLIRIPDALDADDVRGFGTSVGTGECRPGGSRMESGGGAAASGASGGGGGSAASTGGDT